MEVDNFELYDQHDDEGGLNIMQKSKGKAASSTAAATAVEHGGGRAAGLPQQDLDALLSLRADWPQAQRVPSERRRVEGQMER